MTSIILISNGSRPRLLEQTLKTLESNTPEGSYTLTIVADGDIDMRSRVAFAPWITSITVDLSCNIVGRLKNIGAAWSEMQFGRGDWLCFIDDDIAFLAGWLERMTRAMKYANQTRLLGGARHPYHGVVGTTAENGFIDLTDAVAGYCHFMRWSTWDAFGPYDAHAKGTGQSEDYALSRKIVAAGGKVGYIHPPVLAHCGLIKNSEGNPAVGGEAFERLPNLHYE